MKINILIDKNSWANNYKKEILFKCKKINYDDKKISKLLNKLSSNK